MATIEQLLTIIADWKLPDTGKTWPGRCEPISYCTLYGSKGERSYMQSIAREALAQLRAVQSDATPAGKFKIVPNNAPPIGKFIIVHLESNGIGAPCFACGSVNGQHDTDCPVGILQGFCSNES